MEKFKSFIKKLIGFGFGLAVIGALIVPAGDYTGVYDAQPLYDWLTIKKETLLSVGMSGSAVTFVGFGIRFLITFITKSNGDLKYEFRTYTQNLFDRMETIEKNANINNIAINKNNNTNILNTEILMMLLQYQTLIASKKLDSKVLTDADKEEIKTWMNNVKDKSFELSNLVLDLKNSDQSTIEDVRKFIEQSNEIIETVNDTLEMAKGYL